MLALFCDPSFTPVEAAPSRGGRFVVQPLFNDGAAHQRKPIGTDTGNGNAEYSLDVAALGEALLQGLAQAVYLVFGQERT